MKLEVLFVTTLVHLTHSVKITKLLNSMAFADLETISCMAPDGIPYMVPLINSIAKRYLKDHATVILYDDYFYYHPRLKNMIDILISNYAYPLRHGLVNTTMAKPTVPAGILEARENEQMAFIVFTKESEIGAEAIREFTGHNTMTLLIAQTSVYHVKLFLQTKLAADITNLLVFVDPMIKIDHFVQKTARVLKECDILIFSHKVITDSLGISMPVIVTAWRRNHLTRQVQLFPPKYKRGLGGLHLVASASEIPPFVFRKHGHDSGAGYTITKWDGIEVHLLYMLSQMLNFTVEYKEPEFNEEEDVAQTVIKDLHTKKTTLAIGGVYLTPERIGGLTFSFPHTQDCASFISLASTALPKYRAIMGPFLWDVWLALTAVYLLAMFPIAFSVWHSIKPLLNDIREVENMFWYVFGTFTNCFTFTGKNSWSKADKTATKFFIGTYWIFTIIITACYTGSIVAFITLPTYPETIDSSKQLLEEDYKISLLGSGGWEGLFNDTEDPVASKLYESVERVPNLYSGLRNVTRNVHSWRQSAFLGSRRLLEYTVKTNFTPDEDSKRLMFHLSDECFVPLFVSIVMDKRTNYLEEFNNALERIIQSGFMTKIVREVEWQEYRSASGKLLTMHKGLKGAPEDRELNLDDTQGMFLLLGAGFGIGLLVLIIEISVWSSEQRKNRQFGELTLKQRAINKLKEHWETLYACLLAPANSGIIYFRERRVSSAFGEYVTQPYASWSITSIPSPTVEPPSPSPPNGEISSAPTVGNAASLSMDQLSFPPEKPIRMMSF
uniref:Ionotropic receptor 21a n=1 Tax=Adelphocoris lineolatus TaxID=236346 RepID=A0A2I4PGZ7_ADELI|nr:ionotropic receptor 21a [Adelphocoris lineolatus]